MRSFLLLLPMTLLLANCAEVGFAKASNASLRAEANGDATGELSQEETAATPPTATPAVLPKIQFYAPKCMRGTNCTVRFTLNFAQSAAVTFDWHTHDTLYLETPPAGSTAVYAVPDVHYVPVGGQIAFQPGETEKTVTVQNINPYNYAVTIGVRMSNCAFGTYADKCVNFFD